MALNRLRTTLLVLLAASSVVQGFSPLTTQHQQKTALLRSSPITTTTSTITSTALRMAMDPVTYLRTEWISAALCTNQTPRSADVCLQLGTQDGRAITFVPRTIREFVTSTTETDGQLPVSIERQLKQSQERRGTGVKISYLNQRADALTETADESVDVVISMQAVQPMVDNGLDWKASVREAARVLKPGGRLLWVEPTTVNGESYIDYLESLVDVDDEGVLEQASDEELQKYLVFDDAGYDDIDFILQPHTAGVAVKSLDAGLTLEEREEKEAAEEQDKLAEISIQAYERGIKKKRKKKKKKKAAMEE